ncbi:hypothetical protein SISNIDRAFT_467942 [Sistotremastrum niveocremeum HHB9708]|uniref:F-box domain-containing protein n=1 Tax=Sistotremastrum niveocremeum HHB9708 TaxID=1314777 RepID=A0A164RZ13_9AGAM|nr:hypothetical protein SISNIDRAFT_467942 [Sistotremastrum niveocremeum HHB9708]
MADTKGEEERSAGSAVSIPRISLLDGRDLEMDFPDGERSLGGWESLSAEHGTVDPRRGRCGNKLGAFEGAESDLELYDSLVHVGMNAIIFGTSKREIQTPITLEVGSASCSVWWVLLLVNLIDPDATTRSQPLSTTIAMSLSTTPPEILLNIMESLSVGDIVRAAQSCSYLRAFVRSNKRLLANAYNRAYTIHLPLRSSLEDISPELLYEHAAKSVARSARLAQSINSVPLEPRQSTIYSLEDLGTVWDEANRTSFFVRDKILAFLNPDGLFVLLLGPSGEVVEHTRTRLPLAGARYKVACQMAADEKSLFVVLAATNDNDDRVQVFEMCVANKGFGVVTTYLDIQPPNMMHNGHSVAIRDPYCVVANSINIFLVDWRAQIGGLYTVNFCETNGQGVQRSSLLTSFQNIQAVSIHPQEHFLVIFNDDDERNKRPSAGIYIWAPKSPGLPLNHPRAMTSWNYYCSETRQSLTSKFPFSTQRRGQSKMCPIGFRSLSNSSWILDVMIIGRTTPPEELDSAHGAPSDNQPVVRVSFDSSDDWAAHVETTDSLIATSSPDSVSSHGNYRMAGSVSSYMFPDMADESGLLIAVPKFDDGNRNGSGLIRLGVPAELWTADSTSVDEDDREDTRRFRSTLGPATFDELTGRLYVSHPRGFQILQY